MSALVATVRRMAAASAGAVVAGVVAATFDAARAARLAEAPFGATFVVSLGLVLPLALAVGLTGGFGLALLTPESTRLRLRDWFSPDDPGERRERALLLALAPPAALLWLFVAAGSALHALVSEAEPGAAAAGLVLGLSVFGLASFGSVFVLARSAARRLASVTLAPFKALLWSLAFALLVLGLVIAGGEPSGGGSLLSMFGVLRRDELDLTPVWLLGLVALGAVVAPAPRSLALAAALGLVAVVPPAVLFTLADRQLDEPLVALAIERSGPLSGKVLPPLRRRADRDADGYSARFGGGDCDDADPKRNPGADDLPGNGLDEDCSGADARVTAAPAQKPAEPAKAGEAAKLPEGLSVLLVTIDTLRYDMGYAGNPRKLSPRIDELAAESVVFERAYALASYTAKSLPPSLIGKYCSETHRGFAHFNRFNDPRDTFVSERLLAAGVDTASVHGHWYFYQKNYGMERGFARIDSSAQPKERQIEGDRTWTSDKLTDAALAELARPGFGQKPFFLWVHYTDPHADYVPHEGFDFGKDSRARYDGEVAFTDHHVGRLLDGLRQSPAWDRTAVILTSDHGEAFGEHGMIRHGFELWEELVRVPLVVRVPGVAPRRVPARRSLIDLVPTLLELYGLPLPGREALSGHSLVPDLFAAEAPARPILIDMPQGPYNTERRAFIDRDLKLVVAHGRPLGLYDLAADPGEKQNLLSDKQRVRDALDAYKAFWRTLNEVHVKQPR